MGELEAFPLSIVICAPVLYSFKRTVYLSVIDGTWVKPIVSENPEEKKAYEKWLSNDAVAQLIFTTSVMPNVSQLIIPCAG